MTRPVWPVVHNNWPHYTGHNPSGYFGLPEDGAPAAPKHIGARLIFKVYGLL
jgi:hypothetical protein